MKVEYFRCWDDRTWDTDTIEIPDDTPTAKLDEAIATAYYSRDKGTAAFVGFYAEID